MTEKRKPVEPEPDNAGGGRNMELKKLKSLSLFFRLGALSGASLVIWQLKSVLLGKPSCGTPQAAGEPSWLSRAATLIAYYLVVAALVLSPKSSFAEEQQPTYSLPELSVSAAPIESTLETAPVSASVVQSTRVQEQSQDNIQQIIDYIPNLNFAGGTSRPRFFQIRGVGELEQYEGAPNPSVGYIVDDLDLSGLGAGSSLFDIDQIEILRGPQSLRFGANALAGVISQRTAEPTKDYRGMLQTSGGSDELYSLGAALGGPIEGTDGRAQFRLSAYKFQSDGFRKNLYLNRDDTNKRDELTTRAKLRFLPNEWFQADLMATWLDFSNGYDAFAINNAFTTQSDRPGKDEQRTFGTVLRTKSRLSPENELITTTQLSSSNNEYGFDGDWGNSPFWVPYNPYDYRYSSFRRRDTLAQEVRLNSEDSNYIHGEDYRYTVGAYGQRLEEKTQIDQYSEEVPYDSLNSRYEGNTGAVFSQLELPLCSGLSLAGGLRGEVREMSYQDTRGNLFQPTNRMWGGHLTLGADLGERTYGYALVSRGFRGGGFNTSVGVSPAQRNFSPEHLWNIETGIKTELIENRLQLNTALFTMMRRDQQVRFGIQTDPNDPLTFIYITDNAARGRNSGVESELTATVNQYLDLFTSVAYLDTEFRQYTGLGRDLTGRAQSHAPPFQFSVGSKAKFADFFLRTDLIGKSGFYFDDVNDQKSSSYQIVNVTLGYEQPDWSLHLWARNLFDERYAVRGFFFGNEPPDFPSKLYIQRGDPAQFGLTFTYRFS
jgi:iron complex outermembrane receptor protein